MSETANQSHLLVLNSGSSSLKFTVFEADGCQVLLRGAATSLSSPNGKLTYQSPSDSQTMPLPDTRHQDVIARLLTLLRDHKMTPETFRAVGHRVVHGGEFFRASVIVDDDVIHKIEQCAPLAPLHNPANLTGIRLMRETFPDTRQIAVFDTAFHQSMPAKAYRYAVPQSLYREHHVRRYGFHGTSHRYVARECVQRLQLGEDDHQLLIAHLGNGCSVTAVINGQSVDTTMGLTPLEGAVMGTRSGDIDPGFHLYLAQQTGWSLAKITEMLNRESGLLGLSGRTNDMRELTEARDKGDADAGMAIEVFCYRLAKLIGAMACSLMRIDALVFTGGIGENSAVVRANITRQLKILNLAVDPQRNRDHGRYSDGQIECHAHPPVLVIPTDEERQIALDCLALSR